VQRKRILIVDDHADTLELFRIMLDGTYSVLTCESALEAVKQVDEFKPNLLMLDVRMSPVDGVECLRAIRAKPAWNRVPAIALTALARDAEKQALVAAGFQAIVTKPVFDLRVLDRTIEGLLESPSRSDPEFAPAENTAA
jgi:CheY-like chemotaxis protein